MDFNQVINSRRAVNFFDSSRDVPDTLVREVISLALKSPSSFNLQPWSLVMLRTQEDKLRLQKHAMNQAKISEAPVTFIVLGDRHGWTENNPFAERNFQELVKTGAAAENGREQNIAVRKSLYGKDEETQLAFACKNAGFFAMSMMLAAKSLGIDTHPMDGFDQNAVKKEFNIPDNYWVPLLISMGYFDESKTLFPPKWRKTVDDIIVSFK